MPDRQRTFGQFATPPAVADLLLAFCVRRPGDRLLDPSCGAGALLERAARWQSWLAGAPTLDGRTLWGVELDATAAEAARARLPSAHIIHHNFFTLQPNEPFDAIVGNPPYTRAEWIDRLRTEAGKQLPIFAADAPDAAPASDRQALIPAPLWRQGLSRRAGLYTYFFLHGVRFLREGGRFGFVVPNNWPDVAYGEVLKTFLLERFRIIALIEPTVERWFDHASVNTSLVVLEKCSDPAGRDANRVRFIQLREPLAELIPHPVDDRGRLSAVESLLARLLPAADKTTPAVRVRVLAQGDLPPEAKWGIYWRAPAAFQRARRQAVQRRMVPLREWANVQRGFTTGANGFFYLDEEAVNEWGIEPTLRQPLLKSLRDVDRLEIGHEAATEEVLVVPPTANLAGTAAAGYVAWGERQGFHRRRTCAARRPWYVLPPQEAAPLVLPKGIWTRHFAPLLRDALLVDQQLYQLHLHPGVRPKVAAALLNSAWMALQMELLGRINFGEGVLWLAGYEVEALLLPDPRYLPPGDADELEARFLDLANRPVADSWEEERQRPARQALDHAVFTLLGLTAIESAVLLDTLRERVESRQLRARESAGARFADDDGG